MPHIPVLLKEVIEILDPQPGEFFIDGTLGSGGHSAEIIKRISPNGIFLGIDWDKNAIETARKKISAISKSQFPISKLVLVHGNYADLPEILQSAEVRRLNADKRGIPRASGLLLDLGFSSESLASGRGFSFLKNEPLDMRYNTGVKSSKLKVENLTAGEVVNSFSEKDLADIFWQYGEERFSRQIAKGIVAFRQAQGKKNRIETTFDLVEIIKKSVPLRHNRLHPATQVFQALRIYVNHELGNLEKLLKGLAEILAPGGRAAIISYHSLEDRLVKNRFRELKKQGKARILTAPERFRHKAGIYGAGKPIRPTLEEIKQNPRSRSAKLRACSIISS